MSNPLALADPLALAGPIVSRPAARRCVALAILLAVAVLAGSAARFVNLDVKFWYHDEATTSLRVSGHDSGDVRRALTGRVFGPHAARRYQQVNGQRGLRSSVGSLAREDPQHPPLFYALAREWAVSVGDSIVSHDDGAAAENFAVTRMLNRGTRPFLLTTSAGNVLEMVHYLRPDARILLVDGPGELRLPSPAAFTILVYGSSSDGAAAQRLTELLHELTRDAAVRLHSFAPALPCCGAGIRQQPSQLWQLTIDAPSRAKVGTHKPHGAVA